MDYGLDTEDIRNIKKILTANPKVNEVILFGSRAMGNYKPGSDIDIAVAGEQLQTDDILELSISLEQLGFLYTFDIINLNTLKDQEVLLHIKRNGKLL